MLRIDSQRTTGQLLKFAAQGYGMTVKFGVLEYVPQVDEEVTLTTSNGIDVVGVVHMVDFDKEVIGVDLKPVTHQKEEHRG
jgi:hypothetical protein